MDYFDLHCDTAYEIYKRNCGIYDKSLAVNFNKVKGIEKRAQVFAVWIKDDCENPYGLYKNILYNFKRKTENDGGFDIYYSVEGGAVLENDSDRIFSLSADGIKLLTLTWNGENAIAGGKDTEKGLTSFGKTVIEKMNRLKMGCDLSHLNEKSFYKAAEISDYPLATHSNCYGVCENKRNLKDEQIKLIAEKNGVMGITFYPDFCGGDVFEKIYENIFYLCDRGYEDIIAFGSDFDGGEMSKKLDSSKKIPTLYGFLSERGLKKELLCKIFFENAYKFIAKL